jgi:hypothetical protein
MRVWYAWSVLTNTSDVDVFIICVVWDYLGGCWSVKLADWMERRGGNGKEEMAKGCVLPLCYVCFLFIVLSTVVIAPLS